jgi:hypothetical protein
MYRPLTSARQLPEQVRGELHQARTLDAAGRVLDHWHGLFPVSPSAYADVWHAALTT